MDVGGGSRVAGAVFLGATLGQRQREDAGFAGVVDLDEAYLRQREAGESTLGGGDGGLEADAGGERRLYIKVAVRARATRTPT